MTYFFLWIIRKHRKKSHLTINKQTFKQNDLASQVNLAN